MPRDRCQLDRVEGSNNFWCRHLTGYPFVVSHKTKTHAINTLRPYAFFCVIVHRPIHECICHPLIFWRINGSELVPVFGKVEIALKQVRKCHNWSGQGFYHSHDCLVTSASVTHYLLVGDSCHSQGRCSASSAPLGSLRASSSALLPSALLRAGRAGSNSRVACRVKSLMV